MDALPLSSYASDGLGVSDPDRLRSLGMVDAKQGKSYGDGYR